MHRREAPGLQRYKVFVDAGWFLDVPNYSQRADNFTFRTCAQSLLRNWNASYDRYADIPNKLIELLATMLPQIVACAICQGCNTSDKSLCQAVCSRPAAANR